MRAFRNDYFEIIAEIELMDLSDNIWLYSLLRGCEASHSSTHSPQAVFVINPKYAFVLKRLQRRWRWDQRHIIFGLPPAQLRPSFCLRQADVTRTVEACHSNGPSFWQACRLLEDLTLRRVTMRVLLRNARVMLVVLGKLRPPFVGRLGLLIYV